jgi:hypothetical protein
MSTPTPEQIQTVQTNINNIINYNRDVLTNANIKLENAYTLLNQANRNDKGMDAAINFIGGCFWAIGSFFGPAGSIAANVLAGLVSDYATNTPPNLAGGFSSLSLRIETTINQINSDLSNYYRDPAANWNKTFSGSFTTPFETKSVTGKLSDLSTIIFPTQVDPDYYTMLNKCIFSFDQNIWASLLNSCVITFYDEDHNPMFRVPIDTDAWDNDWLPKQKGFYHTWKYYDDTDCYGNHTQYYIKSEYNLGYGASTYSTNSINDSACDYLFINYSSKTANENALFKRDFVFTSLGIPTATVHIHNSSPHATLMLNRTPSMIDSKGEATNENFFTYLYRMINSKYNGLK